MRHNLMKFRLGVGGDLEVKRLVIKKGKKFFYNPTLAWWGEWDLADDQLSPVNSRHSRQEAVGTLG